MRSFNLLVFALININVVYGLAVAEATMTTTAVLDSEPVTASSLDATVLPAIDTSAGEAAQRLGLAATMSCPCKTNKFFTQYIPCPSNPFRMIQLSLMHTPFSSLYRARAMTVCWNIAGSPPFIQPSFVWAKVYGYHCGANCNAAYKFNMPTPVPPPSAMPSWSGFVMHQQNISGKTMPNWVRGVHYASCCPSLGIRNTTLTW